jgi:hypothetical protein
MPDPDPAIKQKTAPLRRLKCQMLPLCLLEQPRNTVEQKAAWEVLVCFISDSTI